jgi:hypothetical protein
MAAFMDTTEQAGLEIVFVYTGGDAYIRRME